MEREREKECAYVKERGRMLGVCVRVCARAQVFYSFYLRVQYTRRT